MHEVSSYTTDKSQLTHLTFTSMMHEGVFSYNRQITADTPDLSRLRCTKVCFHTTDNHSWHPWLSPLRCTKVCSHTRDNHSWHTWLVTSMMHEGVFSYNRQITADTPDLSRLRCTKVCSHTTDNHSWHTWLVTSTMHEGVFSYNRQSQLTPLTCHLYDARRCVFIQQTITVDTPNLSPVRCTKVCSHTTDKSQLTHLTCHVYDARRCFLIQQTNHSWHTWLVTSTMHEGVFSYNS